jgi:antitoxin component YwqK of YwqJK toxin-antitoxin module
MQEFDIEGNMIYEGEYQNEKRHGNGKEYTNNNIDFEGEFKEGKRWNGIANQFNMNGKVVYDCTYQNGKIFNGKEYKYFDDEIKLRTEAEYKEGLLWNAKGYNKKSVFSNIDFEISNGNGVMKDYYSDNVLNQYSLMQTVHLI